MLLFPKLPPFAVTIRTLVGPIPASYPPKEDGNAGNHESHDDKCLNRLGKYSTAQEEQADAAEDDWCRDPGSVWPVKIRLLNPQDDEAKYRNEVKGVPCDTIERDESAELSHDAVSSGQNAVENESIYRRIKEARVFVAEYRGDLLFEPASGS